MTLAVMTRASLGHTGHALIASIATQAIYVAVVLAAVTRIAAALAPQFLTALLVSSRSYGRLHFLVSSRRTGRCWPRARST